MPGKRSIGVAKAGLGLSLFTGLTVVLGYVALQRFGGTGSAPPLEVRSGSGTTPLDGGATSRRDDPDGLRVLQVREPDPNQVPLTSQRTNWLPSTKSDVRDEFDLNGRDTLWPLTPSGSGETPQSDLRRK
jgi:hypothetical protein